MLRRYALVLCAVAVAGCSSSASVGAPNEEQVKQALYEHYATAQGSTELQQTLTEGVGVSDCRESDGQYRCLVENKALGTTIPMYFAYDKGQDKWTFTREDAN